MPITRHAMHLKLRGEYDRYVEFWNPLQRRHPGPSHVPQSHQCRLERVDLRLRLQSNARSADCGADGKTLNISSLTRDQLSDRPITVGNHCYACTAGSGSSCGGALLS